MQGVKQQMVWKPSNEQMNIWSSITSTSITADHLSAVLRISNWEIQPDFNAHVQAQDRLEFLLLNK